MIDVPAWAVSMGEQLDEGSRKRNGRPVLLETADLTTPGVVVGMAGSDIRVTVRSLVWIPVG